MFGLSPATKIYIAVEGLDMRKGFDGRYGLVRYRLGQDPLSGHLCGFRRILTGPLYSSDPDTVLPLPPHLDRMTRLDLKTGGATKVDGPGARRQLGE